MCRRRLNALPADALKRPFFCVALVSPNAMGFSLRESIMYGADGHFDRIADPGEIGLAEQGQQGGI